MSDEGSSGSNQKQTYISGLVHQLKQGDITKTELFQRLADLQSGSRSGTASEAPPAKVNSSSPGAGTSTQTRDLPRPQSSGQFGRSRGVAGGADASATRSAEKQDVPVRTSPILEEDESAGIASTRSHSNLASKSVNERREIIQKLVQEKRRSREQGKGSSPRNVERSHEETNPTSQGIAASQTNNKDASPSVKGESSHRSYEHTKYSAGSPQRAVSSEEIANITHSVKQAVSTAVSKHMAEFTESSEKTQNASGVVGATSTSTTQNFRSAAETKHISSSSHSMRPPEPPTRARPPPADSHGSEQTESVNSKRPRSAAPPSRTRVATTPVGGPPSAMKARVEARASRQGVSDHSEQTSTSFMSSSGFSNMGRKNKGFASSFDGGEQRGRNRSTERPSQSSKTFRSTSSSSPGPPSASKERAQSRAYQREVRHEQDKEEECTFQPEVHDLPPQYGYKQPQANLPFEMRVSQWVSQKEAEAERKRREQEAERLQTCTFRPNVNKTSKKLAQSTSRHSLGNVAAGEADASSDVYERLYRSATPSAAPSRARQYFDNEGSKDASTGARSASVPKTRRDAAENVPYRDEAEELEECTFKPRVNPNRGTATPVKSRYLQAAAIHASGARSERRPPPPAGSQVPVGYEECTFAPRINKVKPEMGSATAYTQSNVYDRLSRAKRSASVSRAAPRENQSSNGALSTQNDSRTNGDNEEKPVMDMQTFMNALNKESPGADEGRMNVNDLQQERNQTRRTSEASIDKEERERRFQEFLTRQNQAEQRKKQHVEQTKQMHEPDYTPNLCRRSIKLAESTKGGSFLDRINRELKRREHENLTKRAAVSRDPECTFQPKINSNSRQKPPRSYDDLSTGDALKRETTQRLLRLKAEQEELEGLTFKPKLTAASEQAEGRLRVREDPSSYLERLQRESQMMENKMKERLHQNEAEELAECTFQPEVHDAPTYVKRIAKSMALTRAIQPPESDSEKPEWK